MKIKVFSTPTCPYCTMVKQYLDENKVEYEDINVQEDKEAAREMVEKTKQMAVPVIEIDGQFVIGFDKEKLKELLKL